VTLASWRNVYLLCVFQCICVWLCLYVILIATEIWIELYNQQEIRSVELWVCPTPMQLFHFWSRDVHPVRNLLLCTKFHQNRMIFHWDMAICRFSKLRPSAILELFYHHTRPPTKSTLSAAAACQISCQSDTQIWRYSYLNLSHIWLEMPIQAPKIHTYIHLFDNKGPTGLWHAAIVL